MRNLILLAASFFLVCEAFGKNVTEYEQFSRLVIAQKISGRINCDTLNDMGYKIGADLGRLCVSNVLPEQLEKFNEKILAETYLISPLDSELTTNVELIQLSYGSQTMTYLSPNGSLLLFSKKYILPLRKDSKGNLYMKECDAVDVANVDLTVNENLEKLYSDALHRGKSFCEKPNVTK